MIDTPMQQQQAEACNPTPNATKRLLVIQKTCPILTAKSYLRQFLDWLPHDAWLEPTVITRTTLREGSKPTVGFYVYSHHWPTNCPAEIVIAQGYTFH